MNTNINQNGIASIDYPLIASCTASCKKLVGRIQSLKKALLNEFGQRARSYDRMLELALNEAEALAHQTGFPFLTFPTLAREKAEEVAAWKHHQQAVRRTSLTRVAA